MYMLIYFVSLIIASARLCVAAESCSGTGILVDIHRHLVNGQQDPSSYGLPIGLGTPVQNSSLWPSIIHNETYFELAPSCGTNNASTCTNQPNIGFSSTTSTTWKDVPAAVSLDSSALSDNQPLRFGNDSLTIWSDVFGAQPLAITLPGFPVAVASNLTSSRRLTFDSTPALGLGAASTLLEHLLERQLIASKAYALYIGSERPSNNPEENQNSSLILGGYDANRFTGAVHTYTQVPALASNAFSPFKLRVTNLSLSTVSGQLINLIEDGGFDAYLTTTQYPLQFPQLITQKLADALSAKPANDTDDSLQIPENMFKDLTITFNDGFTVPLNSSWLSDSSNSSPISAAPLKNSSTNGTAEATNPIQVSDDTALFGAAFLQQLYLIVSYDNSTPTFSLAQANKFAQFSELQPLCRDTKPVAMPPPNFNNFIKNGYLGAVIGWPIAGLAIAGVAAYMFRSKIRACFARKFKKSNRPYGSQSESSQDLTQMHQIRKASADSHADLETGKTSTDQHPRHGQPSLVVPPPSSTKVVWEGNHAPFKSRFTEISLHQGSKSTKSVSWK